MLRPEDASSDGVGNGALVERSAPEAIELDEVVNGVAPGVVNFARMARVQLNGLLSGSDARAGEIVRLLGIHWSQRERAQREAAVAEWADGLSPETSS